MSHEIGVAFVCLVQSIAELICQVFLCYVRITEAAFQTARGVSVFDSGSHSSLVFVSVQNFFSLLREPTGEVFVVFRDSSERPNHLVRKEK